ncbi:MAG TPA: hypothetical protein VK152_03525 [Paludibacter sp.]|nr:hypothetical protein [Paludibacter sp.]
MRKRIYLFFSLLTGFMTVFLVSCTEDLDIATVSKDLKLEGSIPLHANFSFSLADILNTDSMDHVVIDHDSIMLLQTDSMDISTPMLTLVFAENPVDFSFAPFTPGLLITPPVSIPELSVTENIDLGLNGDASNQQVDSVWLKSLNFRFSIQSPMLSPSDYTVRLTFPGNKLLHKNGTPVTVDFTPQAFNVPADVTLHDLKIMTQGYPSLLPVKAEILINQGTQPFVAGNIGLTVSINSMEFDVAFGLFNPEITNTQAQEIPMDISSALKSSSGLDVQLKPANPQIDLQLVCNNGTYLKFNIDQIRALDTQNPAVYADADFNGSSSATERIGKPDKIGSFTIHNFRQLNRNWGKTNLLFDLTKNYNLYRYKFSCENDMDMVSQHPTSANYILSENKIKVKYKAKIPLYFESGTSLSYTLDVPDLGTNISDVLKTVPDSFALNMTVKNNIPVKFKIEFTSFTDEQGNQLALPGFTRTYQVDAPNVDANGLSTSTASSAINIHFNKNSFEDLKKLKDLKIKFSVGSKDASTGIQITRNNTVGVQFDLLYLNATVNVDSIGGK